MLEATHDGEKNAQETSHEVSEPAEEARQEQGLGRASEEEVRDIMKETIELADGGLLLYDDAFLSPELAQRYIFFGASQ